MDNYSTLKLLQNEFLKKHRDSDDYKAISDSWEKCFKTILSKEFNFNSDARKTMFEWGSDGYNWKLLHAADDVTKEEYKESFFNEVGYSSDRMSLDRLLRSHHLFRCMMNKKKYEDWNKEREIV